MLKNATHPIGEALVVVALVADDQSRRGDEPDDAVAAAGEKRLPFRPAMGARQLEQAGEERSKFVSPDGPLVLLGSKQNAVVVEQRYGAVNVTLLRLLDQRAQGIIDDPTVRYGRYRKR